MKVMRDQNNGQTGDADGQPPDGDKSAGDGGDAAGSGVGDGAAEPAVTTEVEAPKQEEPKPPAEPDLSEFDLDELADGHRAKNWRELSSELNNVPVWLSSVNMTTLDGVQLASSCRRSVAGSIGDGENPGGPRVYSNQHSGSLGRGQFVSAAAQVAEVDAFEDRDAVLASRLSELALAAAALDDHDYRTMCAPRSGATGSPCAAQLVRAETVALKGPMLPEVSTARTRK
jgi:hypothetical protein